MTTAAQASAIPASVSGFPTPCFNSRENTAYTAGTTKSVSRPEKIRPPTTAMPKDCREPAEAPSDSDPSSTDNRSAQVSPFRVEAPPVT